VSRDPGLQPERTVLAWRRTALTVTIVTALATRLALIGGTVGGVVAVLSVAGWIAAVLIIYRRTATIPPAPGAPGRVVPLLALVTIGYALMGLLLIATSLL
jgi:hypothetical protein